MQAVAKVSDSEDHPIRENAIEERIRRNLAAFIEQSGYSANQVADLAGVPQTTLGRYLRGENAVSVEYLKPLADVFGRRVDDFYDKEPPPPPADLETARPAFLRSRPGVNLTEEDLADFDAFLERLKSRRAKKTPTTKKK